MGGLNQVKLSMQQFFVTNLMRFLNFNLNNSSKMTHNAQSMLVLPCKILSK